MKDGEPEGFTEYLIQCRYSRERVQRILTFARKYLVPPYFTPDEIINTSEFNIVDIIISRADTAECQPNHIRKVSNEHRSAVRAYRDFLLMRK